jgi:Fe-Mn family superoxide dismutase
MSIEGLKIAAPLGRPASVKEHTMTYVVRPLSCDPTKLNGLSEKLIVSHWENNYGGAVRRLNAITAQLAELDFAKAPVFVINGLKREELIATNSMILHELYFDSLGGDGVSGGAIDEALANDFGSVERWRAEFVATGKALRGGSGWVLLSYSAGGSEEIDVSDALVVFSQPRQLLLDPRALRR